MTRVLRPRELGLLTAVVVLQFLFAHGVVWDSAFAWDASIFWSYGTIPVLVGGLLLWRRRFQVSAWLLHSLEVASAKFVITASVLLFLLIGKEWTGLPSFREAFAPAPRAERAPSPEVDGVQLVAAQTLEIDDRALRPSSLIARIGEPLRFRSSDGHLHTVKATRPDGRSVFNLAVVPGEKGAVHTFRQAEGSLTLSCAVHPGATPTQLQVVP